MTRPTISTIAAQAGVSKAAVSHAINGRSNISVATRERIMQVAADLGWRPSIAGRRLSGTPTGNIGLIVTMDPQAFQMDPFFIRLVTALSERLRDLDWSLLLTVTPDPEQSLALYREWWAAQSVDAFILVDPEQADRRVELLTSLSAPAVTIGTSPAPLTVPDVVIQDDDTTTHVIDYLISRGHSRIARVSGRRELLHTQERDAAFLEATFKAFGTTAPCINADNTKEGALAATAELLALPEPPTVVIYDNDLMACAVAANAVELDISIPRDLSLFAWEDSWLCELVRPQISALRAPLDESAREAVSMLHDMATSDSRVPGRTVGIRQMILRDSIADLRS